MVHCGHLLLHPDGALLLLLLKQLLQLPLLAQARAAAWDNEAIA
jgi:hypothetical protein